MHEAGRLRVALAVPHGLPFLERLLRGIADYARQSGGWTFTRLPEAVGTSIEWLRHWQGDGAVAFVTTQADVDIARALDFPVVNLASYLAGTGVPTVAVDHAAVGELAARHLLERQFRRFGYYGAAGYWYSRLRGESFRRTVEQAGGECQVLEVQQQQQQQQHQQRAGPVPREWLDQQRQLEAWLASLRPPVGVMASTDLRAAMVLEAGREVGLRVPEDVAVIGVDNDPVSEFCVPPLTSVSRNDQAVGREAAALLDRLIGGAAPPPGGWVFVPPSGVVRRRSTETTAVEDPDVAEAVRYIREHVHQRFGVEELLKAVSLSRRSLEYRFRQCLGSSPYDYINQARVDAAKRLLAEQGPMKLAAIAKACGFGDLRRFRLVFRRLAGMSPASYRRSTQGAAAAAGAKA